MIECVTSNERQREAQGHVLVMLDTTEFNYHHLNGLLKVNDPDIGLISNNKSTGFFAHVGLSVEASSGIPLGMSSLKLWTRAFARPLRSKDEHKKLPIESKESVKWLSAGRDSKSNLPRAAKLTLIGDRESDIYELFCRLPDQRTNLLIRSSWNRKLPNDLYLEDYLASLPVAREIPLAVGATPTRKPRHTQLKVKFAPLTLAKPTRRVTSENDPDQVELYVVEVKESCESLPEGEAPIHWKLFTTHPISSVEAALEIVQWYKQRWWIEDLFRTIKQKGLEVESSQFGKGAALQKLVILCFEAALKILMMRQEREGLNQWKVSECFTSEEITFLAAIQPELEGNTPKQQNPHPPQTLAWAVWIIAVLGNWTPENLKKKPPGVITIARGLKIFTQRFYGWKSALAFLNQNPNHIQT